MAMPALDSEPTVPLSIRSAKRHAPAESSCARKSLELPTGVVSVVGAGVGKVADPSKAPATEITPVTGSTAREVLSNSAATGEVSVLAQTTVGVGPSCNLT